MKCKTFSFVLSKHCPPERILNTKFGFFVAFKPNTVALIPVLFRKSSILFMNSFMYIISCIYNISSFISKIYPFYINRYIHCDTKVNIKKYILCAGLLLVFCTFLENKGLWLVKKISKSSCIYIKDDI